MALKHDFMGPVPHRLNKAAAAAAAAAAAGRCLLMPTTTSGFAIWRRKEADGLNSASSRVRRAYIEVCASHSDDPPPPRGHNSPFSTCHVRWTPSFLTCDCERKLRKWHQVVIQPSTTDACAWAGGQWWWNAERIPVGRRNECASKHWLSLTRSWLSHSGRFAFPPPPRAIASWTVWANLWTWYHASLACALNAMACCWKHVTPLYRTGGSWVQVGE